MPKEPQQARRLRKGTKSCIECRERKIRCIWPDDEESHVCTNCTARGRTCVPQVLPTPSAVTVQLTSRERIRRLEQEVSSLWGALRGGDSSVHHDSSLGHNSNAVETETQGDFTEHESDGSELSPQNGPAHLRQLFDNGMLDGGSASWDVQGGLNAGLAHTASLNGARKQLQRLLPPRSEVAAVVVYSNVWTSVYNGMFSPMNPVETGDQTLAHYDDLQRPDADPTAIANTLLSLTLTLEQIADQELLRVAPSMHLSTSFAHRVIETVEKIIVNNDRVACTLSGIETTLLFVRLSLATVDIRKVWLLLRRVIAIAELIGLPRVAKVLEAQKATGHVLSADQRGQHEAAAILWHSIRSIERMAGVLFNLPVSTAIYPMQHPPSITPEGKVNYPAFLGRMSDVVASLQDLDDIVPSAQSDPDRMLKVLKMDSHLRQLASQTPSSWWQLSDKSDLTPDHLLQLFYYYYLARAHIQLALSEDATGRYNYSYTTCLNACKDMAYRFVVLRPLVPAGFFAGRVVDLQIITCAVFLLFTMRKQDSSGSLNGMSSAELSGLMDRVFKALEAATQRSGGDFASKALEALRSLNQLMNNENATDSKAITLRVPLLGKVHVSRKGGTNAPTQRAAQPMQTQDQPAPVMPTTSVSYPDTTGYDAPLSDFGGTGWSMDVMDESPLMPLDTWDANTWLPDLNYCNNFASYPF